MVPVMDSTGNCKKWNIENFTTPSNRNNIMYLLYTQIGALRGSSSV